MPRPSRSTIYWAIVAAGSAALVAIASLPYVRAQGIGPEHVFTGLLINPIDGNTYLAKMREGWSGSWTFTLPYTAEPGAGAFLFTYYLALGHAARWLNASLITVYHFARALGGLALLLTAGVFMARCFDGLWSRMGAWLLFALGSGLGWTVVPWGGFTADLWVAEAIPFLAVLTNAHFGLTLALLLWVVILALPEHLRAAPAASAQAGEGGRLGLLALVTVSLSQVQPLALINAGLILGGTAVWRAVEARSWRPLFTPRMIVFGVSAAPWLVYDYAATMTHPVLSGWNAQNLTPSPPVWDALLSGGLPLLLALVGLSRGLRRRGLRDILLAVWLAGGAAALYAPFGLQRRLALGLWAPICVLAVTTFHEVVWPRLRPTLRPLAVALMALAVVPSNGLVYGAALGAIASRNPIVFLTRAEADALRWLDENSPEGALVAASPEMGLYLPAWSGVRVLYGHPFETVNAEEQKAKLETFYSESILSGTFVREQGIDYVMLGPREQALGAEAAPDEWERLYMAGKVAIYAP